MSTRNRARAGFTLIELLVVIGIIGLLIAVVVPTYAKIQTMGKEKQVKARLSSIAAAVDNYYAEVGDYPPSHFEDLYTKVNGQEKTRKISSNGLNEGSEALVLALFDKDYTGSREEDGLANRDDDELKKSLTIFPEPALFEYEDVWENPIVYIHNRDYEKSFKYWIRDEADVYHEVEVKAVKNPDTGSYYNLDSFQIFSVGADSTFGTDDDIHLWD
ncbi:MAG: type II secretion system protein [Planctomycetota bacterium]